MADVHLTEQRKTSEGRKRTREMTAGDARREEREKRRKREKERERMGERKDKASEEREETTGEKREETKGEKGEEREQILPLLKFN